MRAIDVIRMAQQCGVRIGVEGDDLILDADREPAPQVLDAIRRHKANVVALLSGSPTENDVGSHDPAKGPDVHSNTADELQEEAGKDGLIVREDPRNSVDRGSHADNQYVATHEPTGACSVCGNHQWWQARSGGLWQCRRCHPDMPLTAITLTLPHHGSPPPCRERPRRPLRWMWRP